MTNVQSKLCQPVLCTCQEFQHPWTDKCVNASAGLILAATPYCLRVYTMVYVLSSLMRKRTLTFHDLRRMVVSILQSSAFLVTNSYTFVMYNCLIRHMLGRYYYLTVAFVPSFLASLTAIMVERTARRPLLTLYVANVATETLWNMMKSRGYVRSIPNGQALIFGVSVSVLLYLYRLGLHRTTCKDSVFDILRIFVGKPEEGPLPPKNTTTTAPSTETNTQPSRPPLNLTTISGLAEAYGRLLEGLRTKHRSCSHGESCAYYAITGGLKPLMGGIALQVVLKLLLNLKKIAQLKMNWRKTIFNRKTLNLGLFMGSFSFLYKAVSCGMRHSFGRDDPLYAIPAGLVGSVAFVKYPDITVALYVMWKMLQIVYNLGIARGVLPRVPGFMLFLYSFCTAVLFQAGILEPKNLRQSYFKFLQTLSGDRLSKFNMEYLDVYGYKTSQSKAEVLARLNIVDKTPLPKFAMAW